MSKSNRAFGQHFESIGIKCLFIALAIVYIWIGGMKFTAYEANGISPLVSNSPFMGWLYDAMSIRTFSSLLGVLEILVGLLLLGRFVSARLSAVGAALSCILFVTTISFMFSTPGVIEPSLGFPALSAFPGQFLAKDIVLLAASVFTLGESLKTARSTTIQ
ncbi:YkgB family protein [Paenibacillus sp. GCM10023250]|uniref:YkgB family protein n=1 Tax=Paenibacillus sp. GCM10023250 TaxID=3252648 RepID=UPI00361D1ADF